MYNYPTGVARLRKIYQMKNAQLQNLHEKEQEIRRYLLPFEMTTRFNLKVATKISDESREELNSLIYKHRPTLDFNDVTHMEYWQKWDWNLKCLPEIPFSEQQ